MDEGLAAGGGDNRRPTSR